MHEFAHHAGHRTCMIQGTRLLTVLGPAPSFWLPTEFEEGEEEGPDFVLEEVDPPGGFFYQPPEGADLESDDPASRETSEQAALRTLYTDSSYLPPRFMGPLKVTHKEGEGGNV